MAFQRNTNSQARRYYDFILRVHISQTLSNERHDLRYFLRMNVFKMHGIIYD